MDSWVIFVILGVMVVLMIVMTVIPNNKRKKQHQQMMSSLAVGTKIMTIGRMVGTIVAINDAENQLILNVGSEANPTLITIDKQAIGMVLTPVAAAPVSIDDLASTTDEKASANDNVFEANDKDEDVAVEEEVDTVEDEETPYDVED